MLPAGPSAPRPWTLWIRPRLLALHAVTAVIVAATIAMGLWQLGVYDSRRADERADRQSVATVPLATVLGPDDEFTEDASGRAVSVTGTYAASGEQIWVSGRTVAGRSGYWLVAPFVVDGARTTSSGRTPALLVVRGWSPSNDSLPRPTAGLVRLTAVLHAGEDAGSVLGADRTTSSIRIPLLVNELPYDLYSGYAIVTEQTPRDPTPLTAVPPPAPGAPWTTGLRNLVYAVQWWVFGAFAIFMWWRICSESVQRTESRSTRDQDDSEPQVA